MSLFFAFICTESAAVPAVAVHGTEPGAVEEPMIRGKTDDSEISVVCGSQGSICGWYYPVKSVAVEYDSVSLQYCCGRILGPVQGQDSKPNSKPDSETLRPSQTDLVFLILKVYNPLPGHSILGNGKCDKTVSIICKKHCFITYIRVSCFDNIFIDFLNISGRKR